MLAEAECIERCNLGPRRHISSYGYSGEAVLVQGFASPERRVHGKGGEGLVGV
jgi:hypothetical protein